MKRTMVDWLFIFGLAIIAIALICQLPDADAPHVPVYPEPEEEIPVVTSLPKSTEIITRTAAAAPAEDDTLPDPDEDQKILEALYQSGYFRADVPLPWILQDNLRTECEINDVPFELALGLIQVESNFNPDAVSGKSGCFGLMQLHPMYYDATMSPSQNIQEGVKLLGELYQRYGNWPAALTAYNVGHDNGTRTYSDSVIAAARDWGWDG